MTAYDPAVLGSTPIPAWAWRNPPEPPIPCETCAAVAGARCTAISGADYKRTGRGLPTARVHVVRARRVKWWFDRYDRNRTASNVSDLALERARRRTGPRIVTPGR